jgi:hypothetical protein
MPRCGTFLLCERFDFMLNATQTIFASCSGYAFKYDATFYAAGRSYAYDLFWFSLARLFCFYLADQERGAFAHGALCW